MDLIIPLIVAYNATLGTALNAEEKTASDWEAYVHIGAQVNASDATAGGFGVIYKDKIDLNVTYIGEGDTKWGKHESMRVFSISRIVTPGWACFYMGIGYANVQNSLLVGEHNYLLTAGCKWDNVRAYYQHGSDLNIGTNNNTGLDGFHVAYNLSF